MFLLYSPNMLKTYDTCPKKFYLRYVKNITMPIDDSIFEFGKNIHALASYFLKNENLYNLEQSLSTKEKEIWEYLKSIKYLSYMPIESEYNVSVKVGNFFFGGRIDALVKNNDEYFILDYKTGSAPQNATYDYQTMIYLLSIAKIYNTKNLNFVYLDLKNKKEVLIKYSDDLAVEYEDRLKRIVSNINNELMPLKKTGCKCEYSSICY